MSKQNKKQTYMIYVIDCDGSETTIVTGLTKEQAEIKMYEVAKEMNGDDFEPYEDFDCEPDDLGFGIDLRYSRTLLSSRE